MSVSHILNNNIIKINIIKTHIITHMHVQCVMYLQTSETKQTSQKADKLNHAWIARTEITMLTSSLQRHKLSRLNNPG